MNCTSSAIVSPTPLTLTVKCLQLRLQTFEAIFHRTSTGLAVLFLMLLEWNLVFQSANKTELLHSTSDDSRSPSVRMTLRVCSPGG